MDSKSNFKKIIFAVIPCLIILLATVRLCSLYSERKSYHIDEIYSYGYANSYYTPYIYKDSITIRDKDEVENSNIGVWITGEVFKDYLTVGEDERFSFDSVVYNKEYDDSPPLYEILIHFVSSLYPGTFSMTYSFAISLILYVLSCVLVYLIAVKISGEKICGILTLIYYVMSGVSEANFLFLRIYPLYTALVLLSVYTLECYLKRKQNKKGYVTLALLFVISMLGYFTHYYFILFAFFVSLITCIILLFGKKFRDLISFSLVMLSSVLVYYLVYPYGLNHVFSIMSGDDFFESGFRFSYYLQLGMANRHFFKDTVGFYIDTDIYGVMTVVLGFLLIVIIIGMIAFLFRENKTVKKGIDGFKKYGKRFCASLGTFLKKANKLFYVLLFTSIAFIYIVPASSNLVNLSFIDKYFFVPQTLFIICLIYISFSAFKYILANKKTVVKSVTGIALIAIYLFMVINTHMFTDLFRFNFWDSKDIYELTENRDVFLTTYLPRDLTWLSACLYGADDMFIEMTKVSAVEGYEFPELEDGTIVLISRVGFLEQSQEGDSSEMAVNGFRRQVIMITAEEYAEQIKESGDYDMQYLCTYNTFIGAIDAYEIAKK